MKSGQYCIDAVVAVVNKENNDFANLTQAQLKQSLLVKLRIGKM